MSNRLPFVVTNPPKATMLIDQRLVENLVDNAIEIPWDHEIPIYIYLPMANTIHGTGIFTYIFNCSWYLWVNVPYMEGMGSFFPRAKSCINISGNITDWHFSKKAYTPRD